ncbi:hypothetical protein [Phyllobacterium chamaecytisi]|uniref:hypothetical protein n=1 Tax=Phyllobacterium chamaecytisi TaxID=2876082 RepID=UPI001CCE92E8|nr:hypothetical protein [Phyllobacterium sp. KW56]MBZ9600498.1 hypothetical protein [Phyllobacterium sp. KW56]
MPTTNQAVEAISARVGFPIERCRSVAVKLTEAGSIPAGGPHRPPEIKLIHFLDILIGSSLDVPLRAIPAEVARYRELGEPGFDTPNMPASVKAKYATVGTRLNYFFILPNELADVQIDIVQNWREVSIYGSDSITRFREPGALHSHWADPHHRRAVTIPGRAIAAAIDDLFGE